MTWRCLDPNCRATGTGDRAAERHTRDTGHATSTRHAPVSGWCSPAPGARHTEAEHAGCRGECECQMWGGHERREVSAILGGE